MTSLDINRAIISPEYQRGCTIPSHIACCLEIRRDTYGDAPRSWVDACHARLRWARFCVLWAMVGMQMQIDSEGWAK